MTPITTISDRTPPSSPGAERSAIGAILLRTQMPPEFEDLKPNDFSAPVHRVIWEAILRLASKERKLDILAIGDDLKAAGDLGMLEGGLEYLIKCAEEIPHAEHLAGYAKTILEKATLRHVLATCAGVMSRVYGGGEVDDVMNLVRDSVAELENIGQHGGGAIRIGTEIHMVLENIELRSKNPEQYFVQTGITRFDQRIGGLRPEKLIVVASPPGIGKSAWAGTVAVHNALMGVPSLVVSLEMARDELIERYLAGVAHVENAKIGAGTVAMAGYEDEWKRVHGAARKLYEVPLFVDDRAALTTAQLVGTIRRWYAKNIGIVPPKPAAPKPAFIAVDYLQLVGADNDDNDDTRNNQIAKLTRSLKRLAMSLRVPIVILSQLNRALQKRGGKPLLSDLRDSGSIEQDADTVIFPWREPATNEHGREIVNQSSSAEWIVAKNRGGRVGTVPVAWLAEYTKFENLATDGDGDAPERRYAD